MLKLGILSSSNVYVSTAHTNECLDLYLDSLDSIFHNLGKMSNRDDILLNLEVPVCHSGFKRLN